MKRERDPGPVELFGADRAGKRHVFWDGDEISFCGMAATHGCLPLETGWGSNVPPNCCESCEDSFRAVRGLPDRKRGYGNKTFCLRGHPWKKYEVFVGNQRRCRACRRIHEGSDA